MNFRHFMLCLLMILIAGTAQGQKKSKSKRQTPEQLLQEARVIKDKSPTRAIELVKEAITYARKQKSNSTEGEAYALLGNIYEQIDQQDLALQRYQQALVTLNERKGTNLKAAVYERMGKIFLTQGKAQQAEANFTLCIEWSRDKKLTLRCDEGLTDVKLLLKDTSAVISQLDNIDNKYELDSVEQARMKARRSQAYVQNNDFGRAADELNSSYNSLPKNKQINKEDYQQIQKAQKEVFGNGNLSNDEEIKIRSNAANNTDLNFSNDAQVNENLQIAEIYEADNNLPEAEKYIVASKDLIKPSTDAVVAADVYKKSSEINQRRGKIDAALSDLELYIKAKEKAIQKQEDALKEQIEIVKGQKQIDVLQRDYDLEEKETELMQSQLQTQKIIIALLSLVLIAAMVFFYFLYKNVKAKRRANQKLLLKSLRTQMNPHFIFNALNSVNNFIAKNDEKAANKFLSDFSRLMRKVLDYSQRDFIVFEEEMELNELYLKLEHFRFRDKFDYAFDNKTDGLSYGLEIPPMLIQPFIENAVWHGLRYKKEKGHLKVVVEEVKGSLLVSITDDGIGRKQSSALKTNNQKKYKSTGLENVSRRIELINKLYQKNYQIEVSDLDGSAEDSGTVVKVWIPVSRESA